MEWHWLVRLWLFHTIENYSSRQKRSIILLEWQYPTKSNIFGTPEVVNKKWIRWIIEFHTVILPKNWENFAMSEIVNNIIELYHSIPRKDFVTPEISKYIHGVILEIVNNMHSGMTPWILFDISGVAKSITWLIVNENRSSGQK